MAAGADTVKDDGVVAVDGASGCGAAAAARRLFLSDRRGSKAGTNSTSFNFGNRERGAPETVEPGAFKMAVDREFAVKTRRSSRAKAALDCSEG